MLPADSVVFLGCVGKDKYAEVLQKANKEAGLQVRYRYDEEQPTGRCGVIITGHNRSMCTDLAAANHYKIEHMKENWDVVQNSKIYFVGGFHLTVCVPAVMALAEEAAKENKVYTRASFNALQPDLFVLDICSVALSSIYSTILQGPPRSNGTILGLRGRKRERSHGLCRLARPEHTRYPEYRQTSCKLAEEEQQAETNGDCDARDRSNGSGSAGRG